MVQVLENPLYPWPDFRSLILLFFVFGFQAGETVQFFPKLIVFTRLICQALLNVIQLLRQPVMRLTQLLGFFNQRRDQCFQFLERLI